LGADEVGGDYCEDLRRKCYGGRNVIWRKIGAEGRVRERRIGKRVKGDLDQRQKDSESERKKN